MSLLPEKRRLLNFWGRPLLGTLSSTAQQTQSAISTGIETSTIFKASDFSTACIEGPPLTITTDVAFRHENCCERLALVAGNRRAGSDRLRPELTATALVVFETSTCSCVESALALTVLHSFSRAQSEVQSRVISCVISSANAPFTSIDWFVNRQSGVCQTCLEACEI